MNYLMFDITLMPIVNNRFGNFVNDADIRFGFFEKEYTSIGTDVTAVKVNFRVASKENLTFVVNI